MAAFKRITKDDNKIIAGVCGGIAYSLETPVWLVRLLFLFFAISSGITGPLYVLFWTTIPEWNTDPKDYHKKTSS